MAEPLLDIRDLRVSFRTRRGVITAVDGLSFSVDAGQVLGIVGESGSGKSVSMLSLLKLIRDPNAQVSGTATFAGQDLLAMSDKQLRAIRGRDIAMIFQDPMTALTPVYTIGWHIAEQIRTHEAVSRNEARERAVRLLEEVGIANAARRVDDYPHQFSGGMRQRAVIALALACNPRLLIADEPTTALDVTTQAQILNLMRRLRETHGSAIVVITHDMGVVSEMSDRVLVMYGGRAVEHGTTTEVLRRPRHPYTWGLLGSVPRVTGPKARRLAAIPGASISPFDVHTGCAFAPRCAFRLPDCDEPPRLTGAGGHLDACWLPAGDRDQLRRASREPR
ncbi:ABC transporter ATP-binding protein [Nonomuraea sp. M3C6]|uniref:ABC transporter ATP-binding protein n=1 Tax=Nonomuraea marmarensis TaxID=3351344 RepID=A0ABW7ANW1_9ACTN